MFHVEMFHKKDFLKMENNNFDRDRKVFIESFSGVKTFQTFPDNKDGMTDKQIKYLTRQVSVHENKYPIDGEMEIEPIIKPEIIFGLEKLNSMGAGIYLTINETNGKGRKIADITKVRACFADFDNTPMPETWPIEPSMIVETSPGNFHAYFFTDDTPIGGFTPLQEGIAKFFGSDTNVKDLSRVMRVCGFYHNKRDPFLSRLVHHSGLKYSFGLLVETFPPLPREQWIAPKYEKDRQFSSKDFSGSYGASAGGRNCHIAKRIGGMLKRGLSWGEIEQETYKEAMACSPPLTESETRSVLKSMRRYA